MEAVLIAIAVVLLLLIPVTGFICFKRGIDHRKKVAEAEIGSAEEQADKILAEAATEAENKKRVALVEAKEEILKSRNEAEREFKERRGEISRQERRIQQKEENLDKKTEALEKKDELLNKKIKGLYIHK